MVPRHPGSSVSPFAAVPGVSVMPEPSTDIPLKLLQAIRLKGRLTAETVGFFIGTEADELLARLASLGLIRAGTAGARLTPAGKDTLARLLAAERETLDLPLVSSLYEEFDEHNTALKGVVTAWQTRPDGTMNDHQDAEYDSEIVARLAGTHALAMPLVDRIAQAVPRLDTYPVRLRTALEHVRVGERAWFAHPARDSYHQVWFELHEDLLGVLELSRVDEAKAGRA